VADESGNDPIGRAIAAHRASGSSGARRDVLMKLWSRSEVSRLNGLRAFANSRGGEPGPEGSVGKLEMAELNKAIFEFVVAARGPHGMLIDHYDMTRPDSAAVHGGADDAKAFLRTRANSIEGGTSEILRTVIAERVLGLPKEPAPKP
jgi:alkylation response protein AidB-like acyl-CoA dehydrogenase